MNSKNLALKFLFAALLATIAFGPSAFSQSAAVSKGQFTLSFPAQWGKISLQPGTYSFAVKAENSSYIVSVAEGRRPLGFVLTSTYSPADSQPLPDHALLCVRHSGTCSIGALKVAEGVFFFQLPGNERAQLAQQPDLIERVPVLFAQN